MTPKHGPRDAPSGDAHEHRAPSDCPVCGEQLAATRLGCASCGSELAGVFSHLFVLRAERRRNRMLRVFLASRGNLREVEKHLGVSYPTARLRFADLLRKLDLTDEPEPEPRLAGTRSWLRWPPAPSNPLRRGADPQPLVAC